MSVSNSLPVLNEDQSVEVSRRESERQEGSLNRERRNTNPVISDTNRESYLLNLYTKRLSFAMSRLKLKESSKTSSYLFPVTNQQVVTSFLEVPRNENIPLVYVSSDYPSFYQSPYKNSSDDHKSFKSVRETGRLSDHVAKRLIQSHERLTKKRRKSLLQLSKISSKLSDSRSKNSMHEDEKITSSAISRK